MKDLKQAAVEGNNIEAVKAKRIVINLFDSTGTNQNLYGKYFFNEYPELNNKTIVGIKYNSCDFQSTGGYLNYFDFEFQTINQDNNLGINSSYGDQETALYLLINLFNEKNELIIQNMPLNSLNTYDPNGLNGKIMPFDTRINLKSSYIFSTIGYDPNDKISISLTFYYLDK